MRPTRWLSVFLCASALFSACSTATAPSYDSSEATWVRAETRAIRAVPTAAASETPAACHPDARCLVLMYHYVRDPLPDENATTRGLSVPPAKFEAQMAFLESASRSGALAIVSPSAYVRARTTGCYPAEKTVVLTFDDGWTDTRDAAFPIMRTHGLPFGMAIISSKIGTKGFMDEKAIRDILADGHGEILSHSVHHLDQNTLSESAERSEICDSKKTLESRFGVTVNQYVYPAGRFSVHSADLLRECGYAGAFATSSYRKKDRDAASASIVRHPDYFEKRVRIDGDLSQEGFEKIFANASQNGTGTGSGQVSHGHASRKP